MSSSSRYFCSLPRELFFVFVFFFTCTASTLLFLSHKIFGFHSQKNKLHRPNFSKFLVLSYPLCLGRRTGCFFQQGSCCGCSPVARTWAAKVQKSLPRDLKHCCFKAFFSLPGCFSVPPSRLSAFSTEPFPPPDFWEVKTFV